MSEKRIYNQKLLSTTEEKMTEITKNMKAGFQGKKDSMREKAAKLMDHPGKAVDVYYSASCADKEKMRKYKSGGSVKKYAMGGVAKIRHGEATAQGLPKTFKKKSVKELI
jgi:hypothetical protein